LFLVATGEIKLLSHPPMESVVRTARAGETVPLAAIIDPPVLVTTVEAASDCEVLAIPRQPLIDLLEANPTMGYQVYKAVAHSFERRYRHALDHGVEQ
jgi:CRP-like cAMP-binding protein